MFLIKRLVVPAHHANNLTLSRLWLGTAATTKNTETELVNTLKSKFLKALDIQVKDISGGCGAMYEITVESSEFQGMSRVKQHQMVVDTLKDEIKDMHGVRIHTIVVK